MIVAGTQDGGATKRSAQSAPKTQTLGVQDTQQEVIPQVQDVKKPKTKPTPVQKSQTFIQKVAEYIQWMLR